MIACATAVLLREKSLGNWKMNGQIKSFNGAMTNELINLEKYDTLKDEKVLIVQWFSKYNRIRLNSALGYRPPPPISHMESG